MSGVATDYGDDGETWEGADLVFKFIVLWIALTVAILVIANVPTQPED